MAAAEDEWSKFMKDMHSDLSKLSDQDFANASSLKELVEIQTELKMAEDALLKKSADIAVPLEQLGYERAEELKTNMEKWLPDTPDREKWSQEESPTDKDKEAPMAELPGELEDLVGDLMEQEEDLFEEMEDVSSSAVDSAEARLGRRGRPHLEQHRPRGHRQPAAQLQRDFRPLRRRPARQGQRRIRRRRGGGQGRPQDAQPAYARSDCEGPDQGPQQGVGGRVHRRRQRERQGRRRTGRSPPRSPGPRETERLAGKQAALRNKAAGLELQFNVTSFHHTDLKKWSNMMAQVERDLKAGRYQNALRQRQVLVGGLGNVKQYLEGEFEVLQDTTTNLPTDIQKQILGGMQDPSPAGWEELNRQYFERLSGSETKTTAEKPGVKREKGKGEKGE